MQIDVSRQARSAIVAAGFAFAGALTGQAAASVIVGSPSLPPLGVPYISPGGAGCFAIATACVTPGPLTLTSLTSSVFLPANGALPAVQDIVATASYEATLTPLVGDTIIGTVDLTGPVDETVFKRTSDTEIGSFTTEITGLDLTGTLSLPHSPLLNGAALEVTLAAPSYGITTITAVGNQFRIDSFFDVFIDISLPDLGMSKDDVGPIRLVLGGVPEPSTWAMMLLGLAGLAFAARRRAAVSAG